MSVVCVSIFYIICPSLCLSVSRSLYLSRSRSTDWSTVYFMLMDDKYVTSRNKRIIDTHNKLSFEFSYFALVLLFNCLSVSSIISLIKVKKHAKIIDNNKLLVPQQRTIDPAPPPPHTPFSHTQHKRTTQNSTKQTQTNKQSKKKPTVQTTP